MLRLRRSQCEGQAKTQALYSRRDPSWLDFPDAQKARVAAEHAYRKLPPTPHKPKMQALKEWLIIALHTVQRKPLPSAPSMPLPQPHSDPAYPLFDLSAPLQPRTGSASFANYASATRSSTPAADIRWT